MEEKREARYRKITEMNPFDVPTHSSPSRIFFIFTLLFVAAFIIFQVLTVAIAMGLGLDLNQIALDLSNNEPTGGANFMRSVLGAQQFCLFLLPPVATTLIIYRSQWGAALGFARPNVKLVWLRTFMLFVFNLPLTVFISWINLQFPMSDEMLAFNEAYAKTIEYTLKSYSFLEASLVFFIIVIMPAVAEEILFRGFIQTQLQRIIKNPTVTILTSAFIFAFFHMEFSGFLPRLFLGIILGATFYYSRSLYVSIFFHALNNALSLFVFFGSNQKVTPDSVTDEQIRANFILVMVFVLISWTLVLLLFRRMKDIFNGKIEPEEDDYEEA
ncbi:MAG: hypothetical protein RL757_2975 [Bacteroidota bacterium]